MANDADECVQNCRLHPECGGVTFTKKDDSWEAGLCHLKSRSIAEPYLIGALKTEADMKSTSRVLLQDLSSLPKELDAIPVCSPAPSEAHAYHRRLQLLPGRKRAHTSHGCVQARARSSSVKDASGLIPCCLDTRSFNRTPAGSRYTTWGRTTPPRATPSIRWVQEIAQLSRRGDLASCALVFSVDIQRACHGLLSDLGLVRAWASRSTLVATPATALPGVHLWTTCATPACQRISSWRCLRRQHAFTPSACTRPVSARAQRRRCSAESQHSVSSQRCMHIEHYQGGGSNRLRLICHAHNLCSQGARSLVQGHH